MIRYSLAQIAEKIDGVLEGDGDKLISGLAPLESAGPEDITFLLNKRKAKELQNRLIGAVIIDRKMKLPGDFNLIRCDSPNLARVRATLLFVPEKPQPGRVLEGAFLDPTARVAEGATIYPQAYVGPGVVIEAGVVIHPQVYLGDDVSIGENTVLWPGATIYPGCKIGARCIIHAGAVIGADGFGYAHTAQGEPVKIPQLGNVIIDDDVEIGACACIDRATFGSTIIGSKAKIDNLVQIGHNANIGQGTIIVAQGGIAGSVNIGNNCVFGGQIGISDHTDIGSRVMLAAATKVAHNLPAGFRGGGTPVLPGLKAMRVMATATKLPEIDSQVTDHGKRLAALEKLISGNKED